MFTHRNNHLFYTADLHKQIREVLPDRFVGGIVGVVLLIIIQPQTFLLNHNAADINIAFLCMGIEVCYFGSKRFCFIFHLRFVRREATFGIEDSEFVLPAELDNPIGIENTHFVGGMIRITNT